MYRNVVIQNRNREQSKRKYHLVVTGFIVTVWIANGLFCKLLNLVPRHEQIVARILGNDHPGLFTMMIGISEMFMAAWIITGIKSKWSAIAQIIIVATMNIIEFILAPDLLLWGRFNALFAAGFAVLIYYNEFFLKVRVTEK